LAALTCLPCLRRTRGADARVVNLASVMHHWSSTSVEAAASGADESNGYDNSKMAMILLAAQVPPLVPHTPHTPVLPLTRHLTRLPLALPAARLPHMCWPSLPLPVALMPCRLPHPRAHARPTPLPRDSHAHVRLCLCLFLLALRACPRSSVVSADMLQLAPCLRFDWLPPAPPLPARPAALQRRRICLATPCSLFRSLCLVGVCLASTPGPVLLPLALAHLFYVVP